MTRRLPTPAIPALDDLLDLLHRATLPWHGPVDQLTDEELHQIGEGASMEIDRLQRAEHEAVQAVRRLTSELQRRTSELHAEREARQCDVQLIEQLRDESAQQRDRDEITVTLRDAVRAQVTWQHTVTEAFATLHAGSERAPDMRAEPMRLVRESEWQALAEVVSQNPAGAIEIGVRAAQPPPVRAICKARSNTIK